MGHALVSVALEVYQEEVARMIARYKLLALPVVDDGSHVNS